MEKDSIDDIAENTPTARGTTGTAGWYDHFMEGIFSVMLPIEKLRSAESGLAEIYRGTVEVNKNNPDGRWGKLAGQVLCLGGSGTIAAGVYFMIFK